MSETEWLLSDVAPLDADAVEELEREGDVAFRELESGIVTRPSVAALIHDIVVHDVRKWFGGADIRLDALVIHGGSDEDPKSAYMPGTYRFPDVRDGERLPIDDNGLLIFHGQPLHFLDIFITVSRDREGSKDLATLLSEALGSEETKQSLSTLLGLSLAAPSVGLIMGALSAAGVIGDLAFKLIREVTGDTVGLYRGSWLQVRDGFGVGRHPPSDAFRVRDLSFWYDVIPEPTT